MYISYRFWKVLKDYQKIYIYGNGVYGKQLFQMLCLKGWHEKELTFVVTSGLENRTSFSIPICTVDEISYGLDDSIIVVAVSRKYQLEIENELNRRGIYKYIVMADYEQMDLEEVNFLRNASIEECCGYMADYYISENNLSEKLYIKQKEHYLDLANHRPIREDNKLIVICGNINIGLSKIILALTKKNFIIEIWKFRPTKVATPAECELKEHGFVVKEITSYAEMLCRAVESNPLVYYMSLPIGGVYISEILIKNKNYLGKIIFTEGDVIKVNEYDVIPDWYEVEKYCLENADGVVWRYPAKDFLAQKFSYQYKGSSIHMWDYCSDYGSNFEMNNQDQELRICFLPTSLSPHLDERKEIKEYIHYASLYEILEKFGNRKNCIFHCFSWEATDEELDKMQKLKAQYANFDYFIHITHDKLIKMLQNYDYGIVVSIKTDPVRYSQKREGLLFPEAALKYPVCNKYFDYLGSGIPVIGCHPEIQCNYFDSLGVVVKQYLDDLDIDYLIEHKKQYRENVKKARSELTIDTHIIELIDFMHNL